MRLLPIFLLVLGLVGCTSSWTIDTAQMALTSGAEVVQALDETVAPALTAAVETADQETTTREAFLERLAPWEPVASAMALTRRSFFAAQRGLDAWRAGVDSQWLAAAGCILAGLLELERVLPLVHVTLPSEVSRWVTLFRGYAVGACDP